ncbi:MAG: Methyltransferase domain [Saliniramus fredricksonii]|uniref:Small RNA 2'-O-methyltransferase n=1 Tax=Saliniramus fredricksonii TaxID=1653334 RepID=A0A0P7XX24_9HYPH|nr:methyltransferase [Saliniramus fredricksonii]KPQ12101.1 MAG: Methyltransferase domain [Saliniramus fredricksonii]SCC78683.1 Methyltransferase domain-containing protein [Saliniramus fredricksonii]
MTNFLHEARFRAVAGVLREAGARRILDLGCGDGDFILHLLDDSQIAAITGVEKDEAALGRLRTRLRDHPLARKVQIIAGDITRPPPGLPQADAIVLVEVIEHLGPGPLQALERVLLRDIAPPLAVITTPNAEMNPLLGVKPGRMRHRDHRFEWDRKRFRAWAEAVAARHGYTLDLTDIAGKHPRFGGASQMAVFARDSSGR